MLEGKLSDRQKLILKAIIEDYVDTGEPVGSKSLMDKPYLDFSSATIRNDMQYLEEIGLLEKTHTSSGRIPSNDGYRYYVEHLVTRDVDVMEQFPLIDKIFNDDSLNKEEMIKKAIDLLSDLTNYMTFASEANTDHRKLVKLDLVQINDHEGLLIIITSSAKVETKQIMIPKIGFDEFKKVIQAFDKALAGTYISEIKYILQSEGVTEIVSQYIDYQDEILRTFEKAFSDFKNQKTIHSDINTVFEIPEFRDNVDKIRDIVKKVDSPDIHNMLSTPSSSLQVKIGGENQIDGDCTVISVPYQIDNEDSGVIAVVGPKRMEYKRVIPLLEYLAKNMSKLFNK